MDRATMIVFIQENPNVKITLSSNKKRSIYQTQNEKER